MVDCYRKIPTTVSQKLLGQFLQRTMGFEIRNAITLSAYGLDNKIRNDINAVLLFNPLTDFSI
jgi:hypothetical protein